MKTNRQLERWTNRAAAALGILLAVAILYYGLLGGAASHPDIASAAVAADEHDHDHSAHADETAHADEGDACCPIDLASPPPTDVHDHDHDAHDDLDDHDAHDVHSVHYVHYVDEGLDPAAASDPHAGHDHADAHFTNADGVLWCGEHDLAEAECAICQPDRVSALQPGEGMKLRLVSGDAARAAGVQTQPAAVGSAGSGDRLLARVAYNESYMAHITPMVTGVIRDVYVELGDAVAAGQPLARAASPDIAEARRAYQAANADAALAADTYAREKELHGKRISSESDYRQAEAALRQAEAAVAAARQRLLDLGLARDELSGSAGPDASTVTLRAPFDGVVTERHAVRGESVGPDESIFIVADLSTMWLDLSAPESLVASLRPGARIAARFDALPGRTLEAELTWVASSLDESARTLRARAILPNEDGLLKAGMFGAAELVAADPLAAAVLVPREAIQDLSGAPVVFLREADDLYEVRRVAPGRSSGPSAEIADGLAQGEPVVVAQSFALKSELLKAQFGAGCAHD